MIGGVSGNDTPHYVFFDRRTQSSWDAIARAFGKDRVSFVSASQDFRKVVVRVDGPEFGYIYELIDMDTHKGDPIGDVYDGVTDPLEVRQITYEAADGLKIPAYLTLPPKKAPKNLALVVLPHGGPAIFDTAGFRLVGAGTGRPGLRGTATQLPRLRSQPALPGRRIR